MAGSSDFASLCQPDQPAPAQLIPSIKERQACVRGQAGVRRLLFGILFGHVIGFIWLTEVVSPIMEDPQDEMQGVGSEDRVLCKHCPSWCQASQHKYMQLHIIHII